MELGKNIRKLRKINKLTSVELARRAGIKQSYLSQIETGKRSPSIEVIQSISRELGSTVSELLGETGQELTEEMKRLLYASKDLNREQLDAVIGVAEAFGSYKKD